MLHEPNGAVVVAMGAMREVQVAVYHVVDMVSVRHGLMAAAGTVAMGGFMAATGMGWRAAGGVCRTDGQHMFIHVIVMQVMEMTVV